MVDFPEWPRITTKWSEQIDTGVSFEEACGALSQALEAISFELSQHDWTTADGGIDAFSWMVLGEEIPVFTVFPCPSRASRISVGWAFDRPIPGKHYFASDAPFDSFPTIVLAGFPEEASEEDLSLSMSWDDLDEPISEVLFAVGRYTQFLLTSKESEIETVVYGDDFATRRFFLEQLDRYDRLLEVLSDVWPEGLPLGNLIDYALEGFLSAVSVVADSGLSPASERVLQKHLELAGVFEESPQHPDEETPILEEHTLSQREDSPPGQGLLSRIAGMRTHEAGGLAANYAGTQIFSCSNCSTRSAKGTCDKCFSEAINIYAKHSREARKNIRFPNEILRRFDTGSGFFYGIESRMKAQLQTEWINPTLRSQMIERVSGSGMRARMENWNLQFGDDLQAVVDGLHLPGSDPLAHRKDGLSELAVAGFILIPGAAFFVDAVDRHVRKTREDALVRDWRPDALYEFIAVEGKRAEKKIRETAERLVELALIEAGQSDDPAEWAKHVGHRWQPLGPLPLLPERVISPREAEEHVERLVRHFGEPDSKVTRYGADGGADVVSRHFVVQVKHQEAKVGVPIVRQIFGVATSEGKRAAVFAKNGFAKPAIEFANLHQIVLMEYGTSLVGHSEAAKRVLSGGFQT